MTHEEVFHEYIAAINGDSDYTLAHEFSTPDTLFGYFSYSSEYQPLKTQIDHLDSLVLFYIAKRDSVINAKYISSRDGKVESTYFRVQALNDSIRNNFAKGDVVRERIKHRKGEYEMQIKGYVFDFRTYLVKNEDSVVVFDFPVWVKQDFPVDKL